MEIKEKLQELRALNLDYNAAYGDIYDAYCQNIIPEDAYQNKLNILEKNYKTDVKLLDLKYKHLYDQRTYEFETRNSYLSPWRFLFFHNKIAKLISDEIELEVSTKFAEREINYSENYEIYQNTYQTEEPEIDVSDEPEEASAGKPKKRGRSHRTEP